MLRSINPQQLLVSVMMVLLIVPVHECAHAWMANRLGDPTARQNGRLTLNPFAHVDLLGALSLIILRFGWGKPVPVDSRYFKHTKRDMALVALAGPASNFVMAAALMVFIKIAALFFWNQAVFSLLMMMLQMSLNLCVFNLLPVPPLDGSRLLEYLIPARFYAKILQYEKFLYFGMLILLFTGVLWGPIQLVAGKLFDLLNLITMPLDLLAKAMG